MLFMTRHAFEISDDELRFSFVRSSGPGGQNVNKVNTKAVLAVVADPQPKFAGRSAAAIFNALRSTDYRGWRDYHQQPAVSRTGAKPARLPEKSCANWWSTVAVAAEAAQSQAGRRKLRCNAGEPKNASTRRKNNSGVGPSSED